MREHVDGKMVGEERVSNCRKYEPDDRRTEKEHILLAVSSANGNTDVYATNESEHSSEKPNLLQTKYV